MAFLVSTETTIQGNVTLPPDRYAGTVEWKETMSRTGFERSRKRYKIEIGAEDVMRWGGAFTPGGPSCRIDITAEVASGAIYVL